MVAPLEEGDDQLALREAFLRPRVVREFLTKYDGAKLPSEKVAKNVLQDLDVPADATERTLRLIHVGAEGLGLLTDIQGKPWVDLSGTAPVETTDEEAEEKTAEAGEHPATSSVPEPPDRSEVASKRRPNRIFVGHGKNKKPLDQLTKTLDGLNIPFKVAEEEANRGRPISQKVRDTMGECGAAILIFSADEEFFDKDGNSVWKPSENVANELGAAAILYENRIIVFKEDSVQLATNYRDIGYIEFDKDQLDAKVNELLKELVAFKILRLSVGE